MKVIYFEGLYQQGFYTAMKSLLSFIAKAVIGILYMELVTLRWKAIKYIYFAAFCRVLWVNP